MKDATSVAGLWRRFARANAVRFAVVGMANTAMHYVAYLALWLMLPYLLAHLCSMFAAMLCSYLLHCRITFRVRPTWRTFLLFPLSNLTNVILSTLTLSLAVGVFGIDSRIAVLLGGTIAIPATFLVSKVVLTRAPRHRIRASRRITR
jgi:putative flippase GtrA